MKDHQTIDISAEIGEDFGSHRYARNITMYNIREEDRIVVLDEDLMPYVSSVHVACGFHAGEPTLIRKVVASAKKFELQIGAHPGLPDMWGFGNREMTLSDIELESYVIYQIGALKGIARSEGTEVRHVKFHGYLYLKGQKNKTHADTLVRAIKLIDNKLVLVCSPFSAMYSAAREAGIDVAAEGYIDREYNEDGTLVPRSDTRSLIVKPEVAIKRALRMITERKVATVNGIDIDIPIDTLCIHSDTPNVLRILRGLSEAINLAGYRLSPFNPS